MLTEDVETTSSMNEKHFLSAEELVSLRKPAEEPATSIMCGKFYSPSDSRFEDAMVEHILEVNTDKLSRKRGAKICDLMQAEWNEELNVSTASKLKGKFLQHIGRNVNGKIVLSPEESLFLLENGCIEIMNGETPMSTEEGYSVMLKGNNSIECYQVYSHLSNQGYRVVPHQAELGMTKYEKSVTVNNRKRRRPLAAIGEPEQKRLTFSGAFPSDHDASSSDTESKDMLALPSSNNTIESKNDDQENAKASQLNTLVDNEVSGTEIENGELQSKISSREEAEDDQIEEDRNQPFTVNDSHEGEKEKTEPHYIVDVSSSHSNNNKQDEDQTKESEQDRDCIDHRPLICVCNHKEISDGGPIPSEPANCVICKGQIKSSEPENIVSGKCPDSTSVSHPINDIDVMDVDSQSTEVSCGTAELSKANLEADVENVTNLNNHVSNNSHSSVINGINDVAGVVKDVNDDSNLDVMSCASSDSSESDVLSLEASNDSMLDPCEDEVTLLEVTKKETKPLAVIDLISDDDEEEENAPPPMKIDDEITVVKVCSRPSTSINTNVSTSRKFYNCKKEERASPTIPTDSYSLTVQFPDLFRKDVVCLSRPPLNLLPSHVKPSKEVYVLDLKQKSDQFSAPSQGRVWNSYRDMQDYQRARRQNRHGGQSFSQFQNREHNSWGNREFGNSGMQRDQRNMYSSRMPDLPAHNANGRDNYSHTGDNGNLLNMSQRSFGGSSPFHPGAPPTASMNSVVSIRQQDMNVSLLGEPPFPPLNSNNTLPPVQFPPNMANFANLGPAQIMAEVQRTAFSVATSMLSSMLGRGHPGLPNAHFSQFNAFQPPQSNFNYDHNNAYDAGGTPGYNAAFNNQSRNGEHFPMQNRRNFRDFARRGRPFPCQYRNLPHKRSWSDVKAAVGDVAQENGSDIEEVPISPHDILWDESNICPLVKPGFRHGPSAVLNMFNITQPAKLREECWTGSRYLPTTCSLEISYDVYPPGFNYKKTAPDIPKYRIVVCRSTDPVPSFSDVTLLQRQWKDGAQLLFAVVDNGDISFQSFNNICLPVTIPHEE